MLNQKMLMGDSPYIIRIRDNEEPFPRHRHIEIEFLYCMKGSLDILINDKKYRVKKDEIVIIPSLVPHEIPNYSDEGAKILVIEAGPSFLHSSFYAFSESHITNTINTVEKDSELYLLLEEISLLSEKQGEHIKLMLEGDIYKICGHIFLQYTDKSSSRKNSVKAAADIEKAIEFVHNNFSEQISIERVAKLTGYSKSNFCKAFKEITGETFHNTLNRKRVENACIYLNTTALQIAEIAEIVGFSESKAFCRAFKGVMGITPGKYRKAYNR